MPASYKDWLDLEYSQWIDALNESTVHNFKDHPMIRRMLGDIDWPAEIRIDLSLRDQEMIKKIDNIGRSVPGEISGTCWRMVYYAARVLDRKPGAIVEIGGGVGQFYAIMRALGFEGYYFIFDLPEVKNFQWDYLMEVGKQTGLPLPVFAYPRSYDFCVSFYALGEFDDALKDWYIKNVVSRCAHGFIVWNPHSGASSEINFPCSVTDEYPASNPGNKVLEW